MKLKAIIALAIIAIIIGTSSAVTFTSGKGSDSTTSSTTSSNDDENNDVEWQSPSLADNTFSASEVEDFTKKVIDSDLPTIPEGEPIKVLTLHGVEGEDGWDAINNDFSGNMFETDEQESAFKDENQRYQDGEPTTFATHMEVVKRLAKLAADNSDLNGARMIVLIGTIKVTDDKETREYSLPCLVQTSRSSKETGRIVYPAFGKVGIVDNDKDLAAPFAPSEMDNFEWYDATST